MGPLAMSHEDRVGRINQLIDWAGINLDRFTLRFDFSILSTYRSKDEAFREHLERCQRKFLMLVEEEAVKRFTVSQGTARDYARVVYMNQKERFIELLRRPWQGR